MENRFRDTSHNVIFMTGGLWKHVLVYTDNRLFNLTIETLFVFIQ
jgi:hypothetical protein